MILKYDIMVSKNRSDVKVPTKVRLARKDWSIIANESNGYIVSYTIATFTLFTRIYPEFEMPCMRWIHRHIHKHGQTKGLNKIKPSLKILI